MFIKFKRGLITVVSRQELFHNNVNNFQEGSVIIFMKVNGIALHWHQKTAEWNTGLWNAVISDKTRQIRLLTRWYGFDKK